MNAETTEYADRAAKTLLAQASRITSLSNNYIPAVKDSELGKVAEELGTYERPEECINAIRKAIRKIGPEMKYNPAEVNRAIGLTFDVFSSTLRSSQNQ